jgi:hypothetical protein
MTSVCLPDPSENETLLRLQHAELREWLTEAILLLPGPLVYQGTFKTTMIMFFVVLCKVFPYTSSALVEFMPTKLIAKICLFWEKPKCCLSSNAFHGLL